MGIYREVEGALDATGMRIAVVAGRFNDLITMPLLDAALGTLRDAGLDDVPVHWVPGAFEIPLVAQRLATAGGCDAVICLGAVIRGDTPHFDFVAGECAAGIARAPLDTGVPVVFGVLTTDDVEQAKARSGGAACNGIAGNKGEESAVTAIEMVSLLRQLPAPTPARHERPELMLRLVLPKGSLERATMQLFEDADLAVTRGSDVDYRGSIDDPRVDEVRILRPQEIPRYVADGMFDVGITGRDWIEERNADVVTLSELHYSKATARPIRVVLAVAADSPAQSVTDLPSGLVVHTEYPELTARYFEQHGVEADVQLSYGATEAKVPDIADAVVEITETGRALRAAGLRILDTILVSYTELIASPAAHADPEKRKAMEQLQSLLTGALEARGRVLLKLNVDGADLDGVIALLPALKSPTVSKLFGEGGFAVETVVAKSEINTLIPELLDHGANGIIELPISKIVP